MAGIPATLYKQLRRALIDSGYFESDARLRAVFTDARIHPWRDSLPQANQVSERAEAVIDYLYKKSRRDTQENGLVLLLQVLGEKFDEVDSRHQELFRLAGELQTGQRSGGNKERWNTEAIRELLSAAFSDGELTTLCFDHFRPVYEAFGMGMGKGQKIQQLVEYCTRQAQIETLLQKVKERNPNQYRQFEAQLKK